MWLFTKYAKAKRGVRRMAKSLMSSVDETIKFIEGFDFVTEVLRLDRHNKDVGNTYIVKNPDKSMAMAILQFSSIKSIPNMARRMVKFIETRSGTPAECCALAAVLWYIGNPNDVLPDNRDGCIGFLDDAAILNLVVVVSKK